MSPSLADTLCIGCGLCCDGSLFADVELAGRAEVTKLEALGLEIEDDDAAGALLSQPCAALRERRCSIYRYRPKCCRTFECQLLQEVRRGAVDVERARQQIAETLERIGRVRELMRQLGHRCRRLPLGESCAEALLRGANRDPKVDRKGAQLEAAMSEVAGLIRKTFLGA